MLNEILEYMRRGDMLTRDTKATPTGVLRVFQSPAVVSLAQAYPFINADFKRQGDRVRIVFRAYRREPWWIRDVAWESIRCTGQTPRVKASPCSVGATRAKVFFRDARTLGDYIVKLDRGEISVRAHGELFTHVFRAFGDSDFMNHNTDVRTLHFKAFA